MNSTEAAKDLAEAVAACRVAIAYIEGRLGSESVAHHALLEVVRSAELRASGATREKKERRREP